MKKKFSQNVKKSVKLDPVIKKQWVAALRSGSYKQGMEELRPTPDTFCCYGVLCNLHAIAHPEVAKYETDFDFYLGIDTMPAETVMLWATGGAACRAGELPKVSIPGAGFLCLEGHNDKGVSFADIATAIETQL